MADPDVETNIVPPSDEGGTTNLVFEGEVREYHPATGLNFVPGAWDYPNEHVDVLMATGRFKDRGPKELPLNEEKE